MPNTAAKTAKSAKPPVKRAKLNENVQVWDESVQQFHGGQDWQFLGNFCEDFSVTTNGLGTPKQALEAARRALDTIDHYPPANQEPALTSLARFLWPQDAGADAAATCCEDAEVAKRRLLLGNGASELIDLVVRTAPAGPWKPGPTRVQYKEYQRSADSHGREILSREENPSSSAARLFSLVNPTNPTGDYQSVEEIKHWIETNVPFGSAVTVDESMQLWVGPHWREDSLTSQSKWIQSLFKRRQIAVFVIHSWTKIWSCTGIRLGSVICPTVEHADNLRRLQVPWSVNTAALAFLDQVVTDHAYLDETWRVTPDWNQYALTELKRLATEKQLTWQCHGETFLSWIWIDMGSEEVADKAVQLARAAGVPVRWGKPGYAMPTHVRIAVRKPEQTDVLIGAWQGL